MAVAENALGDKATAKISAAVTADEVVAAASIFQMIKTLHWFFTILYNYHYNLHNYNNNVKFLNVYFVPKWTTVFNNKRSLSVYHSKLQPFQTQNWLGERTLKKFFGHINNCLVLINADCVLKLALTMHNLAS